MSDFSAGDVLGFSSWGWPGLRINLATRGIPRVGLSHIGIVAEDLLDGQLLLFEATATYKRPCMIKKQIHSGVQAHSIRARHLTYDGKVWHYPLREPLSGDPATDLAWFLERALRRSREPVLGRLGRWILRREDRVSLFSSAMVAGALLAAGRLPADVAGGRLPNPNRLIRALRRHEIVKRPKQLKSLRFPSIEESSQ